MDKRKIKRALNRDHNRVRAMRRVIGKLVARHPAQAAVFTTKVALLGKRTIHS